MSLSVLVVSIWASTRACRLQLSLHHYGHKCSPKSFNGGTPLPPFIFSSMESLDRRSKLPGPTPSTTTTTTTDQPYSSNEDQVAVALQAITNTIRELDDARRQELTSKERIVRLDDRLYNQLVVVSLIHPSPGIREEYRNRAKVFRDGDEETRSGIILDIVTGLGTALAAPFVFVGGVLLVGGSIIKGVGSVLGGLGRLAVDPVLKNVMT